MRPSFKRAPGAPLLVLALIHCVPSTASAQDCKPAYHADVTLDPDTGRVEGTVVIDYACEGPPADEIVLFIMGGVFVIETVSVVLQVASFKLVGKRIFRMAPLHHHFELKGWPEPRVIVRFWIITLIVVLVGLATLKIR